MTFNIPRLTIAGANGQVGSLLSSMAKSSDWHVIAIDREHLDITNAIAVHDFITEHKPDVIINAAAHTAVDKAESEIDASYAINRDGPRYLAEAAASLDIPLLHISTDYVFAGDKDGLYLETDPVSPQGVYGAGQDHEKDLYDNRLRPISI